MKDLFYGTVYDIREINLTQGKRCIDFGKGFYTTAIKAMRKYSKKKYT